MDHDTERRAHALLMDSLDISPADRPGFLRSACAGDTALRQRVEALLVALEESEEFLESPAWAGGAGGAGGPGGEGGPNEAFPIEELAGRIRGYTPERLIASGGMASIYEARQADPPRPVALKIMRRGMRSAAAVQRFRFEGEVLARLEHPGIARIFEAGAFEDGHGASVPFYAMELIRDAMPLTGYADANGLTLDERLRLFAEVCDAVHHGHLLGVIHRDLKPGNILVDASGRPKVIDFGIARPSAAAQAWITQSLDRTTILGTLNYMSPEQCAAGRIDIRTDVYSLGVVLFEMVTGRLPLDLSDLPIPAALRAVEQDPRPRPSAFNPAARGDVDAIVMHAIETDPSRRYQTVSELAADVRRLLAHQPVQARPATTLYQLGKFARRHRVPVAAAAVAACSLVVALGLVSRFAVVTERARAEAVRQQQRAEHEARVANEINGFWIDIIQRGSPYEARRADLQVREALDLAAPRVASGLADPAVRARLHDTFAGAYQALGIWDAQLEHAEAAWRLRQAETDSDPGERLRAGGALAAALLENNRLDEARASAAGALAVLDLDPTGPIAERPSLLQTLARAAERAGDYEEAERLFGEAVAAGRDLLGDGHALTLVNASMHAGVLVRLGRTAEALELLTPTLAAQESLLGPDHPDPIATLTVLARVRQTLGDFDAAEADYRVLLERASRVLGAEHGYVLLLRNNLASLLREAGRLGDAEAIFRAVLDARTRAEGADAPITLQAALNLATTLNDLGRPDEAEPLFRSVIDGRTRVLGPEHPDTLNAVQSLGSLFVRTGRHAEAVPLYEELLVQLRRTLPPGNIRLAPALRNYALVLLGTDRAGEAVDLLVESHDILLAVAGPGHPQTIRGAEMVCEALERLDRPDELAAWRARCEAYRAAAP